MTEAPSDAPDMAIVVVTRDRSEIFRRCVLPSLRQAAEDGHEVIVIDQSATDDTKTLAASVAGLRYDRSGPGLSRGRNVSLQITEAPLVAFIDDDVTFLPEWPARLAAAFGHERVGAACGRGTTPAGTLVPGAPAGMYGWPTMPFGLGSGFNMAFRRAALDEVGGFDEGLGAGSRFPAGEDTDVLYRLMRTGWKVACTDDATVVHHDWRSPREERRVHFDYGVGAGAQTAKHALQGDRVAAKIGRKAVRHHLVMLARSIVLLRGRVAVLQIAFLLGMADGYVRWRREHRRRIRPEPT